MRIIFSGDWQCTVANIPQCRIIVDQIIGLLKKRPRQVQEKVFFVFLGDAKESFNGIDLRITNFLVEAFSDIQRNCDGWFFVRGNHDSITTSDGVPSLVPLINVLKPVAVGDVSWTISTLDPTSHQDVKLWTVPFFRDPKRQREVFRGAYESAAKFPKSVRILAFHNEIKGCKLSAFAKGEGLTLADIGADKYDVCVGGHIHHPQYIQPNVYYAGSPFAMDWGECNIQHTLLEVDISSYPNIAPKIIPHNSLVPSWWDRDVPGFIPQKSYYGCRVRLSVPVSLDPLKEMNAARKRWEVAYPGAILHLVPDFQNVAAPVDKIDLKGGDSAILRRYLEKLALPADVTVDQLTDYIQKFLPSTGAFGVQGLHFRSVDAWNVLSFKHVKLDLDREGLTSVIGKNLDWGENISNGSGKSSLTSLPFIALFGRSFKNQTNDEWARQETTDPAKIDLLVDLPDGKNLRIVRGRRPATLRVYVNNSEVTMGDKNATQTMIEHLTNLTWDVLTNSVYIGQREIGSVFGTDKERKELFSRLLGLDRYLDAEAKLRKIRSRHELLIALADSEIFSTEAALTEAGSGLGEIEAALKETPTIDAKDLKTREYEINTLEQNIKSNQTENEKLDPVLEANQKEFEDLLSKGFDAIATSRSLQDLIEAATKVSGRCHVCGNKVSVAALEVYTTELEHKYEKAEFDVEFYEQAQETNRIARRALMEKVQANRLANGKIQNRLVLLHQESTKLKEQADARQRLEGIRTLKKTRVKELTKRKDVHERAKTACLEEKQFVEICINAVGRDGLPAYLCSVAAPQLNAAAARYSQVFSEGEIGLQFAPELGGGIEVRVCNIHGGKATKDQSSGEMRMAGIIAALSFRDALVAHNILCLDEPSEGLDPENAAAFGKGLNSVVERFKHVMVISHSTQVLANLEPDRVIEVVKQSGVSVATEKV